MLLVIDQGYTHCSIALSSGEKMTTREITFGKGDLTKNLTAQLLPLIEAVCVEVSGAVADIKRIGATVGPSSFTGLRIILASLQGIGFANNARVFSCTRLELMAYSTFKSHSDLKSTSCSLDNQRGQSFKQTFRNDMGRPIPLTDVRLENEPVQDLLTSHTGNILLEYAQFMIRHVDTWSNYAALKPFYGHTPEFKKNHFAITPDASHFPHP